MSAGDKSLPGFDNGLWTRLLERCHEEGMTITEVLEAWTRRALRQERTLMPMAKLENGKILPMRGR